MSYKIQKSFFIFFTLLLIQNALFADITAEYRFDECEWDGTPKEIIDYSGSYNGTKTANDIQVQVGKLNNGALFPNENNITDIHAIKTEITPMDIGNQGSISFWFKSNTAWNKGDGRTLIDASARDTNNPNTAADKYFFIALLNNGKIRFYLEDASDNDLQIDSKDNFSFSANTWVHLTFTWDLGNSYTLYINGQNKTLNIKLDHLDGTGFGGLNFFHIGDIILDYASEKRKNSANGLFDEVKIFNTILSAEEIQKIYENENDSKNYDGTKRDLINCSMPVPVADYHLDECKYEQRRHEVFDSSGNNNHLTSDAGTHSTASGKVARAATFDGINSRIYGKWNQTFSKEVTLTAWINTTNPKGDGYPRIIVFSDSSGDYKPSTALSYDHDFKIIRGWTANSKDDRSNTVTYDMSARHDGNWHFLAFTYYHGVSKLYVDGIKVDSDFKDIGIIQAGETISIGGRQNTNHNDSYHGSIDEVKIFDHALTSTQIQNIYNNENSGKNYNALIRNTVICSQAIFNAVNQNGGCFRWDNNITTKIAGDPINLTILAADQNDANSSLKDVNITKLELLSFTDPDCTTLYNRTELWTGNQTIDNNGCFNPDTFIYNKAIRCAKIHITGIFKGENIESNSTDTFSIRPKSYILQNIPAGKLTAEHTYTFKAVALNSDGTSPTPDYNTSIIPQANKYLRDGSKDLAMEGSFTPTTNCIFNNGSTSDIAFQFDNVGIIGLELNDTTWTKTDADDTPLANRIIHLEQNLTFIPAKFKIDFPALPVMENYNNDTFTYYANDLTNMSAVLKNLDFKVTALGENNSIMTNYQNPQTTYFANNSNFALKLSIEHNPNLSVDINESSTKDLNFTAGIATLQYNDIHFNFTREHNVTKEPITMQGVDSNIQINITDSIDSNISEAKIQTFGGNTSFYYAKVVTRDLRTAQTPTPHKISFVLFSSTPLSGFEHYTKNWYINKLDNFSNWQQILPKISRKLNSTIQNATSIQNEANTVEGIKTFNLVANPANTSLKAFFHLDIPEWLWFSKYEAYDYAATSTCASHPCFSYIYQTNNDKAAISSGDFKGASFDNNFTNNTERKAVKILR